FFSVRYFLVTPMNRVVGQVRAYADAPEDARRIITPSAGLHELRDAEVALNKMQTQLTAALKQKDHLAQMGAAVAKISHDLRNILTTASLMADRLEGSDDPAVQRTAPKLLQSLSRAVNLCEGTLAFGRAQEPPPALARVNAAGLLRDVVESESLGPDAEAIEFDVSVETGLTLRCDAEQIFRVLSNLIRNARQAIAAQGGAGVIRISAQAAPNEDGWDIRIRDTGPGLPEKALEHLFKPFQGGARKGGSGLGLAIAAELVRGHGGALTLECSTSEGTEFRIWLPSQPLG
ncbi:MAG: sensor histidine kinase, partial [Paracoccaceae bacterium]